MADSVVMGLNSPAPMNSGASPLRIFAMGSYTHNAATGAQVVPVAGMLSTALIILTINQNDATMTAVTGVPAANQFTAFPTAAPTANCKVAYFILQ